MSNGTKIFKQIDPQNLPAVFRELADALEKGGEGEFACVDDFKKFKISGKLEFGQVVVKMKFKTEQECAAALEEGEEPGAPGKPSYKSLKKRMKSSFRMLVKMIHDGQVPPEAAVESFLEDSELMVSYEGYGDEFYASYAQVCETFRQAYASGNVDEMHKAVDKLVHEKARCHAKYA